ncbi:S-layer homology domain-containing protein [Solibacillus silvestris]
MANQPKKYKKFVATAATATLVASAIVPVASAASLSDIKGNTHEEAITSLVDAGVINGYPDGTFQPNKTLTRSDVVKLLGKYLVSKGLEVPADYKTNVRFNDLTSASNDELLKYAAVVYDAGVFSGSNGNLLAGDNITRENMAVVLVRAFDTLNNIDLVSYVQGQEYKKDVKDLFTAKAEARAAIEVLDFFDITNPSVANFNPKGSTTRGQFATFLYKTINTDFSAVTGVANSAVSEIKAINNTTVEVTFKEAVDNKEALDFTIDGLEVKNAVVKQTDAKTFVLTTAPQTGDKVYTLNVNAAKAGTFKGISAVVPTAIKVTTPSVQGTIGQQVTVKAEVTVPEGQSKAGIPVTFNIVNDNTNLNNKIEVVAYTNESGVASYSYTRYYKHNDSVAAYATDKSTVVSNGTVYWAESLAIKEVTTGNTFANGSKKVYEITGAPGETVNVTFKENVQVDPSKLVRTVEIKDVNVRSLNTSTGTLSSTSTLYPYEVTTGGVQIAYLTLDREGKATFTVEGSNATVTPVVFKDGSYDSTKAVWTGNGKLGAQELQATAAPVTFSLQHTLALDVEAKGSANAAADTSRTVADVKDVNSGGRTYEVKVRTNDGKLAPETTPAYVTFEEGSLSPDKAVYIDGVRAIEGQVYKIEVKGKEGKASFRLTGAKDAFAQPTVFLDNGTSTGVVKLDKSDLKVVSAQTFFVDAVVKTATLKADADGITDKDQVVVGIPTTFTYQSTDQNGFPYYEGDNYNVTFQFATTFGNLSGVTLNGVALGTTRSVTVPTTNGKATVVIGTDRATDITVTASANNRTLPVLTKSVEYVKGLAALTAVNEADDAEEVLEALLLDDTFRAQLIGLPLADQKTIAAAIYAGLPSVNGYSEAGLKAAFTREYNAVAAVAQAAAIDAVEAANGALPLATLKAVPGINTSALEALDASYETAALNAIGAGPFANLAALQAKVDLEVAKQQALQNGAANQAKVNAVIAATTVAELETAVADLNDQYINGLLADYNALNNRQKATVLSTVKTLSAGATLTSLQLKFAAGIDAGEAVTTAVTVSSASLNAAGTELTLTFSEALDLTAAANVDLAGLGLGFSPAVTLGTSATAVVGAGPNPSTIVITLGGDATIEAGVDLTTITLDDAFGDAIVITTPVDVTQAP